MITTPVFRLSLHLLANVSRYLKSFLITISKAREFGEDAIGVAEYTPPCRTLCATLVCVFQTAGETCFVGIHGNGRGSVSGFRRCVIHWITTDLTCNQRDHHASYDSSHLYKADQAKNLFSNMATFIAVGFCR